MILDPEILRPLVIPRSATCALHAVLLLAREPGRPVRARDIAEAIGDSPASVSKVLHALAKARIVSSKRGLGGGYVLSSEPDRLTLFDVLTAAEGPVGQIPASVLSRAGDSTECDRVRLADAVEQLAAALQTTTISEALRQAGTQPRHDR